MPKVDWTDYQRTLPPWMGTPNHQPKVLQPGGATVNPALFPFEDAVTVQTNGAATLGAASLTVDPVPANQMGDTTNVIPAGSFISFGAVNVKTTASVNAGATTIPVAPIAAAIADNVVGTYEGGRLKRKYIPDGTLLGRTYAERDAGTGYGPASTSGSVDEQIYLLAFPVLDATEEPYCELYMHGNVVYEDRLPGWSTLSATHKAKIRELYHCIKF